MATAKKPASTSKPAKRGPTKAASLKALGLTQEDLDDLVTLKNMRRAHAAAQADAEAAVQTGTPPQAVEEELVQNPAPEDQVFFARNLRGVDFRMRLNRQKEKVAPEPLKPRGQRGDLLRLEKEDLNDQHLLANLELGVIEIITAAEAASIVKQQSVNTQGQVHPAIALLRSATGEEIGFQGAEQYVDESVVVAELNPVGGEYGELVVDRGGIRRTVGQAPEQGRQLGGNPHLISDGFAAARAQDEIARQKGGEGPGAGGVSRVVVDTPKKVVPPKPKGV